MGTNRLVYVLAGLFLLSAGASASAKVKLTLATWYSIPETKAAVDAFVRRNPDIDVSILAGTGGTYDQQLLTWAAGGRTPDVLLMYDDGFATFASSGILMDITRVVPPAEVAGFYPYVTETARYKGRLMGLPFDWTVPMVFINKQVFAKAGVAIPQGKWDWNDFLAIAKKTTSRLSDGKTDVWGLGTKYGYFNEHTEVNWVLANGGKFYSESGNTCLLNSRQAVEAIDWYAKLHLTHKVATSSNSFESGKAAMMLGMKWFIQDYNDEKHRLKGNFDMLPVPYPPGGDPKDSHIKIATKFWCVSRVTKHPKETLRLFRYMAGREGSDFYAATGPRGIPGHKGVRMMWPEQTAKFIAEEPRSVQLMPGVTQFRKAIDAMYEGLNPVWQGNKSARAALDDVTSQINAILRRKR